MNEPVRKTYAIEYWSCGKDVTGHFHTNEKRAKECMGRQSNSRLSVKERLVRNLQIIERYLLPTTQKTIAAQLGVCTATVGHVLNNAKRICNEPVTNIVLLDGRFAEKPRRESLGIDLSLSWEEIEALTTRWDKEASRSWLFEQELYEKYSRDYGPALCRCNIEEALIAVGAIKGENL